MTAVDEFDVAEASAVPLAPPRRRDHRAAWPWLAAAVIMVLGGLTAAQPMGWSWQVGIIDADLSVAPAQDWRATVDLGDDGILRATVVGRAVVLEGDAAVVALDARTGKEQWRLPGDRLTCDVAPLVTCVRRFADAVEVVTIDSQSGETTTTSGSDDLAAAVAVAGGLALLEITGTGLLVTRRSPDGSDLWSTPIDNDPLAGTPEVALGALASLLYVSGSQFAVIDLESGGVLAEPLAVSEYDGTLVATGLPAGDRELHTTLTTASDRTLTRPVSMPFIPVDDTVDDAVAVGRSKDVLSATDTTSGEVIWQVVVPNAAQPIARLTGTLVVEDLVNSPGHTLGLDLATGRQLWERDAVGYQCWGGSHVLVCTDLGFDGLLAIDVRTGAELWRLPLRITTLPLQATDAGLFTIDGSDLVRYRWG